MLRADCRLIALAVNTPKRSPLVPDVPAMVEIIPGFERDIQVGTERVVVTEWRFAPGAETGHHVHARDYVVVLLITGTLRLEEPEGVRDVELQAGARPKGVAHNVINATSVLSGMIRLMRETFFR